MILSDSKYLVLTGINDQMVMCFYPNVYPMCFIHYLVFLSTAEKVLYKCDITLHYILEMRTGCLDLIPKIVGVPITFLSLLAASTLELTFVWHV